MFVYPSAGFSYLTRGCSQIADLTIGCTDYTLAGLESQMCRCDSNLCNYGQLTTTSTCYTCSSLTDSSCSDRPTTTCTGASCYTVTGNDNSGRLHQPRYCTVCLFIYLFIY